MDRRMFRPHCSRWKRTASWWYSRATYGSPTSVKASLARSNISLNSAFNSPKARNGLACNRQIGSREPASS